MIVATFLIALVACWLTLRGLDRALPADFLAARVNSRSNHSQPARQIGGLAAAPAAIVGLAVGAVALGGELLAGLLAAAAAAAMLAVVGYLDDRKELGVAPRFALQFAAAAVFVLSLPPSLRIAPELLPFVVERAATVVFLVWCVNMVNFMDGLDLMVVSGVGVPHLLLACLGVAGLAGGDGALLAAAVAGALAGFLPFNRPPARIFLGDSGSLSLGYLTGACILLLAFRSPLIALLPFAYFFVDSISTIVLRLTRRENILKAHSSHAYQVARRSGRGAGEIAAMVAAAGCVTTGLFGIGLLWAGPLVEAGLLAAGVVLAALLALWLRLGRPR